MPGHGRSDLIEQPGAVAHRLDGRLDLTALTLRTDRRGALEWLRERGFIAPRKRGRPATRRIVAIYPYRDAHGTLLYEVVRLEPKDFRVRMPDGKGSWAWRRPETRVPYRLPELLAAELDEPVFIVEGEKDVDALAQLGLVATTNDGGAGKWPAAFADYLAGRRVVAIPDNDIAGERHARQVVASLRGVAATAAVLPLDGLPPKGDVSDWIAAGGTAEQLRHLAERALAEAAVAGPDAPAEGDTRPTIIINDPDRDHHQRSRP